MAEKSLSEWSLADLAAALIFAEKQIAFWEKFETDTDTKREAEIQENYNCWENRADILEDHLFSRFEEVFEPFSEKLKIPL